MKNCAMFNRSVFNPNRFNSNKLNRNQLNRLLGLLVGFLLVNSFNVFAESAVEHSASVQAETGKVIGKHIFGLARDFRNDPLLIDEEPLIYDAPAYQITLSINEKHFKVALFDHAIAGVYLTELAEDSGAPFNTSAVSLETAGGAHSVGAALKSIWNTVLFSESSLVNAQSAEAFNTLYAPYFKYSQEMLQPYQYGWVNEVILLDETGNAKAIKNYVAGRTFASSIFAMPDGKTFYFHDGNHSGNLYLFIAEEANSFAKGELFVIPAGHSKAPVSLGSSSALKMKFKLKKADFEEFFKSSDAENQKCGSGYTFISTVYGEECLKPQKKNRKYVGQFEPIRSAAIKGVAPFSKAGIDRVDFDSHQNVIKVTENTGEIRQYVFKPSDALGTQYLITHEG